MELKVPKGEGGVVLIDPVDRGRIDVEIVMVVQNRYAPV